MNKYQSQYLKHMLILIASTLLVLSSKAIALDAFWDCGNTGIKSNIYGGGGGSAFNKCMSFDKTIFIRSGKRIDGIGVAQGNLSLNQFHDYGNYSGGGGGKLYKFYISRGDRLVSIRGTYAVAKHKRKTETIFSIQFETLSGIKSRIYGTNKGTPFSLDAPSGWAIAEIMGRTGKELDAIGSRFEPLN